MSQKYVKPGAGVKFLNRIIGFFADRGLTPGRLITLETKGRKTGRPHKVPLAIVEYDGAQYLVAPRGNTEWYRNVKAAGGIATIRHGKERRVTLEEVPVEERAPIIKKYLGENPAVTKAYFGVDPEAGIEEFKRIAADHPTLLIRDA